MKRINLHCPMVLLIRKGVAASDTPVFIMEATKNVDTTHHDDGNKEDSCYPESLNYLPLSPAFSPTPSIRSQPADEEDDISWTPLTPLADGPSCSCSCIKLDKADNDSSDPKEVVQKDTECDLSVSLLKSDPPPPHLLEMVATNPLILQEIFKYSSAKTVRLVCSLWNSVVLSISPPQLYLSLPLKVMDCCLEPDVFVAQMNTIDPKLAKMIIIDDCCNSFHKPDTIFHSQNKATYSQAASLTHIGEKFGEKLQSIDVTCRIEFLPALYLVLQDSCPGITEVLLVLESTLQPVCKLPMKESREIPMKPKLKFVDFRLKESEVDGDIGLAFEFLQNIVYAAPNLDALMLVTNMYPDLSKNDKLTFLHIDGVLTRTFPHPLPPRQHDNLSYPFNLAEISRMMFQVSNSLQQLYLHVSEIDKQCRSCKDKYPDYSFHIPEMKNLKCLLLHGARVFQSGHGFRNLNIQKLPKLDILKISGKDTVKDKLDRIQDLVQPIIMYEGLFSNGLQGLTCLQLNGISNPEFLKDLKTPCPFLDILEVTLSLPEEKKLVNVLFYNTLKACDNLKLTVLKIAVTFIFPLSRLVNSFSACEKLLEDLKLLKIVIKKKQPPQLLTEDTIGRLEQNLLKTRGMKLVVFKGLPFEKKVEMRLDNWSEKNDLPIMIYGKFHGRDFIQF